MKLLIHSLGISLLIFSEFILMNAAVDQAQVQAATPTNDLKYKIIKDADSKMKVNLILDGGKDYILSNFCRIMKSNVGDTAHEEIANCPENKSPNSDANTCVKQCTATDIKLPFDKLSPRTNYFAVFTHTAAATAKTATTGGTVFGLELPLLVNPQVTITIDESSSLKLCAITFNPVNCPIFYNGVEYAEGTGRTMCIEHNGNYNSDDQVPFDLMIPHYEMKCVNYPSFFYKLQNQHTLFDIDVYKPQYYVTYKSTEKTKYSLKFTNKFSYEMCRFGIKDVTTAVSSSSSDEYTSNCGGEGKDCYAPCNNVVLTLSTSNPVVDVLIQTRYKTIKKVNNNYVGYKQQKFVVIIDTDVATDGLLHTEIATGVTLNVPLFNPETGPKFATCTVAIYAADKPRPPVIGNPVCGTSNESCDTDCTAALTIQQLPSGQPFILEITASSATANTNGLPASFVEYLFFRTEKASGSTFPTITSTVTATNVLINHPADNAATVTYAITDDTCAYYISPHGKDVYVCAFCSSSYPCRGYCKEPQTILGLTPGTEYDLKVVTHKEFGSNKYEITTPPATITLTTENIDKGFKVIGTLSPENAATLCNYKVKVEQGSTYVTIHECPATPPPASSSSIVSKVSPMFVARASLGPQADAEAINGAPSTQTGINTATSTPTTCTEAPFCANIQFTTGYDRLKKYQVSVTTKFGLSTEVTIDIPANPLQVSEPVEEKVTVIIERDQNKPEVAVNIERVQNIPEVAVNIERDQNEPEVPVNIEREQNEPEVDVNIERDQNEPEVTVNIESDENKPKVTVNIERDGNKLKVTTTLPTGVADKTCGWELRNSTSTEKPLLKSCNGANDNGCESFPSCTEFEIVNVEDIVDYHLTVYVSDDSTIIGTGEIKKGETYDTSKSISKNTTIMAVAGAGIIVILVAVVIVVMKNRN